MTDGRNGGGWRRRRLLSVGLAEAVGLAGCAGAPAGDGTEGGDGTGENGGGSTGTPAGDGVETEPPGESPTEVVGLEPVATGFDALVEVVFAPAADRRYVVEQGGTVRVHGPDGVLAEPFLGLGDAATVGGEKGLLGLALHPGFADNRRCFVRYSAPRRSGTPQGYSHTFVLAEFRATDDGRRVRPGSERTLLEVPQPQGNHNAGDLAFGPDGLLYVAVGDGGGAGDRGTGHADDWYDGVAGGNGQDVAANLLGSILRIDPDGGGDDPYGIPADNPLVGEDGRDEHYAWGLRNPWRLSIDGDGDRLDGPDLYAGDVGQDAREEVDLVRRGGNYGWNVREGTGCYGAEGCPAETADGEPLLDPVVEYPHDGADVSGISVIGGYVYRGSSLPSLRGRYVFADWRAGDRLFVADPPDADAGAREDGGTDAGGGADGTWPTGVVSVADRSLRQVRSFATDGDGELYVVGQIDGEWGVGRIVAG